MQRRLPTDLIQLHAEHGTTRLTDLLQIGQRRGRAGGRGRNAAERLLARVQLGVVLGALPRHVDD